MFRIPAVLLAVMAFASAPPKTKVDNVVEVIHGVKVSDPYRWLEDQNSPETRKWLEQQMAHTEAALRKLPGRDALGARVAELMRRDTYSLPVVRGERHFFTLRKADQNQADLYVRDGAYGADRLLIDANAMSADHSKSVRLIQVSDDGKLLAYGIRTGGEDEVLLRLLDVDSGKELEDEMPKDRYWSLVFRPSKEGFYYTAFTPQGPRVRYHQIGTAAARDREVFGAGLGRNEIVYLDSEAESRYMAIVVSHGAAADQTKVYVKDLESDAPPVTVVDDIKAEFTPTVSDDRIYLRTNWEAPHGRVFLVDVAKPSRAHWREIIPEGKFQLEGLTAAGNHVVAEYLENAATRLTVFDENGKRMRDLGLPALGKVAGMSGTTGGQIYYQFTSFAIPPRIVRAQLGSGNQSVWAESKVPFQADGIQVKQVWYTSKDGTRVPMFLAHRKGVPQDGGAPVLMNGYGGFRSAMSPGFSAMFAVWMERGGVVALPNLRGGSEFGEAWHQAGMLERKQNTFDDFIAAAEYLVQQKYTRPSRLAIMGGSNGGLLVGAAAVQRPDLFGAVICGVPLLDMVRYHQFLVARWWIPEYGSSEDPNQFRYLLKYSPYHNVTDGAKYPAMLFVTGDSDTRVAPLHARKMTARMQAATGSGKPVLLLYDTKSGHSAGKPVAQVVADTTDELAFLFWQAGVR